MFGLLWALLIGLCAGWLAGQIMKGGGHGLVGDMIIGVIGALIGGPLLALIGFAPIHVVGQIITATIGAIVLILVLRAVARNRA